MQYRDDIGKLTHKTGEAVIALALAGGSLLALVLLLTVLI